MEDRAVVRLAGVERDGALVAVVGLVVGRIEPAFEGAKRITGLGSFDLDHIGAEISEMHAGGGPCDVGAHFHYPDVLKYLHAGLRCSWSKWLHVTAGRHKRWRGRPCAT